jgi:membrane protease subunit HflK
MTDNNGRPGAGGPWSGKPAGPPDLDALLAAGRLRLRNALSGGGRSPPPWRPIAAAAAAAVIAFGVWTTWYTVPSDSVAVVQRFGAYLKQAQPGLHFKLPLGVDVATTVPVKRQLKQEFGFTTPGAPTRSRALATGGSRPRWSPAT